MPVPSSEQHSCIFANGLRHHQRTNLINNLEIPNGGGLTSAVVAHFNRSVLSSQVTIVIDRKGQTGSRFVDLLTISLSSSTSPATGNKKGDE